MIRTYCIDGDWLVADDTGWLDGTFSTEEAAITYAQQHGAE